VVALACDLDLIGSCFFASLTAVLLIRRCQATAWYVRAFVLFCRHDCSPWWYGLAIGPVWRKVIRSGV